MQGDRRVIQQLNKVLTNELTAINQYFLHARLWKNWGFERLAKHEMDESMGEMKHADKLIERIILLDGMPNLQNLNRLGIGENIPEGLNSDLGAERQSRDDLLASIKICEEASDFVSRALLRHILKDTEEHIDSLEAQRGLIDSVGLQNYLQSQMHEDGE